MLLGFHSSHALSPAVESLVSVYLSEHAKKAHCPHLRRVCDGVSVCQCSSMSLSDYFIARSTVCARLHQQCKLCPPLLKVAETVLKDGFCTLRQACDMTSANTPYDTNRAKQKLLQLPLVAIRIGKPGSGTAFTLLLEHYHSVDYKKMSVVLNAMVAHSKSDVSRLSKSIVKKLLGLAQSNRERECIRYTLFKSTPTQA